jgi:hypothetical protein
MYSESIGRLDRPKSKQHSPCLIMKMSVNGGPMIIGLASWLIKA